MQKLITVGQIIDESWDHYRKHFVELMNVMAWILIVAVLNTISFTFYPTATTLATGRDMTGMETFAVFLALITNFIIAPIIGIWIFNSIIILIHKQATGVRSDIKKIFRSGWKYFWPTVLISVLFALLMIVPILMILPGTAMTLFGGIRSFNFIASAGTLLLLVGIVAALALAIRWAVNYVFIGYALLIDDQHGKAAFSLSSSIIKGRFWKVLLRAVVPKLLFFFVFAALLLVLTQLIDSVILGAVGLDIDLQVRLATMIENILIVLLTVLVNPIILIADYLLFESAKATTSTNS